MHLTQQMKIRENIKVEFNQQLSGSTSTLNSSGLEIRPTLQGFENLTNVLEKSAIFKVKDIRNLTYLFN